MIGLPRLPDLWRLLREADLEAIRREAGRSFGVLLMAEALEEARRLAVLLTDADGARHPWLRLAGPAELDRPPEPGALQVAVMVSRQADLDPALALAAEALRSAGVPLVTVVVGTDAPTDAVVRPGEAARALVAGLDAEGLPTVARALLTASPLDLRLALARQLPPLRRPFFKDLIEETARANALYALTTGIAETVPVLDVPLNLADIVVLTKNQLVMSYRIALGAGRQGRPRELLGEVVGVIGGGFLFRQGARTLVGLVPVAGIVPKVAVAYAGTLAIGRAVAAWAAEGRRLSPAAVRRFYREAWGRGRQVAEALAAQAKGAARRPRWRRFRSPR